MSTNLSSWSNVKEDSAKDSPSPQQIFLLTVSYPPVTLPNGQVVKTFNPFGQNVSDQQHILLQSVNSVIPLSKSKESVSSVTLDKCDNYTPLVVLNGDGGQDSDQTSEIDSNSDNFSLPHELTNPSTCNALSSSPSHVEQFSSKFELEQNSSMISFETPTLSNFTCDDKEILENETLKISNSSLDIRQDLKRISTNDIAYRETDDKLPNELCSIGWNTDTESDSEEVNHIIKDKPVLPRAKQTLPATYLDFMSLPDREDAVGIFAKKEIPNKTLFGPMDGVKEPANLKDPPCPGLKLLIESLSGSLLQLSVENEELTNWMRYVRPAERFNEQNVSLIQMNENLYFTTMKTIKPGEELRVWYSTKYAFNKILPLLTGRTEKWRCSNCPFICTTNKPMNSHLAKHKSDQLLFEKDNDSPKKKQESVDNKTKEITDHLKKREGTFGDSSVIRKDLEKKVQCEWCNLGFNTTALLNIHMLMHAADNLETPSDLTEISSLEEDESVDDFKETFFCDVCSKEFGSSLALAAHYRSHYDENSYECPLCKETFEKLLTMKSHIRTHMKNGVYDCTMCNKSFATYKKVRNHIRVAHSDRLFSCPECFKTFPTADKVKNHLISHSDERQFLCADCGKQFKRKDKLCRHMKYIHKQDNDKIKHLLTQGKSLKIKTSNPEYIFSSYKCRMCETGFKRRGCLVNHVLSRHPDMKLDTVPDLNQPIVKPTKDYLCQYCDKVYKSSTKRKNHILKNHPGASLPPYKKHDVVSGTLESDVDIYTQTVGSTSADPHSCKWCNKQYATKAKLLQHQRKMHLNLMPKSLRKPCFIPSVSSKCTKKMILVENKLEDSNKTDDISKIIADESSIIRSSTVTEIPENENSMQLLNDGGIIVDAPTLKKALKLDEASNMDWVLDSGLEQLLAESRPDQYFKILTQGGITIAQPVEIWDPLSLTAAQVTNSSPDQTHQSASPLGL